MPLSTDTTHVTPVANFAHEAFEQLFPGSKPALIGQVFKDVDRLFRGEYLDYQANDLKYHDYRHTLQVVVCFVDILLGRQRHGKAALPPRQFELGLMAALLHDVGYLKLRTDTEGTGAKYTFCHVLRSCAMAASYMPSLKLSMHDSDAVLGAIRCTGPTAAGSRLRFHNSEEQILASVVATADYVAQMAASDYPDELGFLYAEFDESAAFASIPSHERTFKSAEDLIARTPAFWREGVLPRLEKEFCGVYKFLALPDGTNPYIDAIEANMRLIAARASGAAP